MSSWWMSELACIKYWTPASTSDLRAPGNRQGYRHNGATDGNWGENDDDDDDDDYSRGLK